MYTQWIYTVLCALDSHKQARFYITVTRERESETRYLHHDRGMQYSHPPERQEVVSSSVHYTTLYHLEPFHHPFFPVALSLSRTAWTAGALREGIKTHGIPRAGCARTASSFFSLSHYFTSDVLCARAICTVIWPMWVNKLLLAFNA